MTLRHAFASGDKATVGRMIKWDNLRASLRNTIARNAGLLTYANESSRAVPPALWQRVRALFGHLMLHRFIETSITPDGLTKLYRATQQRHVKHGKPAFVQAGISYEQVSQSWRRVKRAVFLSPFEFMLELEDDHVPE